MKRYKVNVLIIDQASFSRFGLVWNLKTPQTRPKHSLNSLSIQLLDSSKICSAQSHTNKPLKLSFKRRSETRKTAANTTKTNTTTVASTANTFLFPFSTETNYPQTNSNLETQNNFCCGFKLVSLLATFWHLYLTSDTVSMFNLAAQVASMASVAGGSVSTPLSPGFSPQSGPNATLPTTQQPFPSPHAVFRFFPPPPHNPASAAFLSAAFPSAFQPRQSKLDFLIAFLSNVLGKTSSLLIRENPRVKCSYSVKKEVVIVKKVVLKILRIFCATFEAFTEICN